MIFLDYIWTFLVLISVIATVLVSVGMVLDFIFRNYLSFNERKWLVNSTLSLIFAAFALVALNFRSELVSTCFEAFANQGEHFPVTRLLAFVWIAITTSLLLKDGGRIIELLKLKQSLVPVSPSVLGVFEKCRKAIGSKAQVYHSTKTQSAFTFGWLNPKIVVPCLENKSTLECLFFHELIHARDRDVIFMTYAHIVKRLLFFHPLIQMAFRRQSEILELAADEQAVEMGKISPHQLATALVKVSSRQNSPFALNASRDFKILKRRIEALGENRKSSRRLPFLLALLIGVFGLSLAQAEIALRPDKADSGICLQVKHEKVIESWLSWKSKPVICVEESSNEKNHNGNISSGHGGLCL